MYRLIGLLGPYCRPRLELQQSRLARGAWKRFDHLPGFCVTTLECSAAMRTLRAYRRPPRYRASNVAEDDFRLLSFSCGAQSVRLRASKLRIVGIFFRERTVSTRRV